MRIFSQITFFHTKDHQKIIGNLGGDNIISMLHHVGLVALSQYESTVVITCNTICHK